MKMVLKISIVLFLMVGTLVVSLFVAMRRDYPVAALVTDDPSLPSRMIGDIRLHLKIVEGPADAATIIVLHGGPGGDFRSLSGLDALSDDYRIVYYDQRGAGLSERVESGLLTLDGHIAELDEIISQIAPDTRHVLVGHSWGAILAAAYLGRYPGKVSKAVLIEPGFLDAAGRDRWEAQSRKFMSGPSYWREAILTGFRAQHVNGPDQRAQEDFLIGHMVDAFANHPLNPYHCGTGYTAPNWRYGAGASEMLRDIGPGDLNGIAARAADFDGQVLLMAGACNVWTGSDLQHHHRSHFRDAHVVVVDDAGHDVVWDNPTASVAAIRVFLAALAAE